MVMVKPAMTLPGRARRRRGAAGRRSGRRLPGLGRVRDGRGRRRATAGSTGERAILETLTVDPPGRRADRPDLLGRRGRRAGWPRPTRCCGAPSADAEEPRRWQAQHDAPGESTTPVTRVPAPAMSDGRRMPTCRPAPGAVRRAPLAVTPGGVNSPVRAFRSVGGTPRFMVVRLAAPTITDADGNDLRRPGRLVGADDPRARAPGGAGGGVRRRSPAGSRSARRARARSRSPRRSSRESLRCKQVRLVSSGTEATMSAIRLARGFTGRSKIVKFAGCYHGHVDALLAVGRFGRRDLRACPTPPGSPRPPRPR